MQDCVFCNIAEKNIPTDLHYESDQVVAFSDMNPIAPVHILIIPREHIISVNEVKKSHGEIIAEMFIVARDLAQEHNISEKGYKLLIRTGEHGGQEIPHLHLHLIGGAALTEGIHPR